jgi:DNA polymerase-3 subunit delta'
MNDTFSSPWEPLPFHALLWEQVTPRVLQKKWPQASLWVGPRHASSRIFVDRLMAMIVCEEVNAPCGACRICSLVKQGIHPDIHSIRPEAERGVIKIEQIRELQQTIYHAPQRGTKTLIVIEPADKMNMSAANALLKILEEPPAHVIFLLIAEQLSSIPATILSRCQKFPVPSPETVSSSRDYLSIGGFYPEGSPRSELFSHHPKLLNDLYELINKKVSPCTLAAQWSTFIFEDMVWLLYLLTAEAIRQQLLCTQGAVAEDHRAPQALRRLAPTILFQQLEKINAIIRKINHNINMNQTLVLEDLLLGYMPTHFFRN